MCGLNGAERRRGRGRAWRTPEELLSSPGPPGAYLTLHLFARGKSGTLHLSCWEEERGCGRIVPLAREGTKWREMTRKHLNGSHDKSWSNSRNTKQRFFSVLSYLLLYMKERRESHSSLKLCTILMLQICQSTQR